MDQDRLGSLLPRPSIVEPSAGRFTLTRRTVLAADSPELAEALRTALPYPLPSGDDGEIALRRNPALGPEAYRLSIRPGAIEITAGGIAGAFYAGQTLRQLLPDAVWRSVVPDSGAVPCAEIADAPALEWRGAMLDVARHFFPKRTVLRLVDLLAMHKFNRLHLHLTDDQGWRIGSRAEPRLLLAAARPRTQLSHGHRGEPPLDDGTPHGGRYTLDDLAEITAYAAARAITVVPEIDVPGHSGALLAALPELAPSALAPAGVGTSWGVGDRVLAPLPGTLKVLKTLLAEVIAAMPGPYLHLGGDEVVLTPWTASPEIEAHRRALGLDGPAALHARFLRDLAAWAGEQGRRPILWDEAVVSGGAPPEALVMAWRGPEIAARAMDAGHDVVDTPVFPTYFDYGQAGGPAEPASAGGPFTLEDVAAFTPLPGALGTQFQLWTERLPDERSLDYAAFPRACALAASAWSGPAEEWPRLRARIAAHLPRLDAAGVEYRPLAGPHPWQEGGTGARRARPADPPAAVMARHAALARSTDQSPDAD